MENETEFLRHVRDIMSGKSEYMLQTESGDSVTVEAILSNGKYPIVGFIGEDIDEEDEPAFWTLDGRFQSSMNTIDDLRLVPKPKEPVLIGWYNIGTSKAAYGPFSSEEEASEQWSNSIFANQSLVARIKVFEGDGLTN